jgi:hypothetical protein
MRTLEVIKKLVYPEESIDWIEVLKETILLTAGNNTLVEFKNERGWLEHIYLYSVGDPNEYLIGVAVIGDNVFAMADDGDGNDVDFGTAWFGNAVRRGNGIGLTKDSIIKACQYLIEGKYDEKFDFNEMKSTGDYWYEEYFLEGLNREKDEYDSFVSGKACGYISIT